MVNYLPPEPGGRFETVLSHLRIVGGAGAGGEEHRDSSYRLRTYSLAEWTALVDRSAMRIEAVTDDAGVPMDPPAMGYGVFVLKEK